MCLKVKFYKKSNLNTLSWIHQLNWLNKIHSFLFLMLTAITIALSLRAILKTIIPCHRYLKINNFAKKQYYSAKFGGWFNNLLGIKSMKFCSDWFESDTFIVHYLWSYFFRRKCTDQFSVIFHKHKQQKCVTRSDCAPQTSYHQVWTTANVNHG